VARDFRIPRAYKALLAIAAVVGPIYWLLATPDGQRRTDMALMSLLGRPAFDAALDRFDPRLDELRLRELFPTLDLRCADARSPFGDRLCTAVLGSFNQYPAQGLTLYFRDGSLAAVKVLYQPVYHREIRNWVERRPGRLHQGGIPMGPRLHQGVASLPVAEGLLVMKDGALGTSEEPALLWIAASPHAAAPGGPRFPASQLLE
jgi:hypothetical protein